MEITRTPIPMLNPPVPRAYPTSLRCEIDYITQDLQEMQRVKFTAIDYAGATVLADLRSDLAGNWDGIETKVIKHRNTGMGIEELHLIIPPQSTAPTNQRATLGCEADYDQRGTLVLKFTATNDAGRSVLIDLENRFCHNRDGIRAEILNQDDMSSTTMSCLLAVPRRE